MPRYKDVVWDTPALAGNAVSASDALLSVMMDIRDELKLANGKSDIRENQISSMQDVVTRLDKRIATKIKLTRKT